VDASTPSADREAPGYSAAGTVWVADPLLVKLGRKVGDAITLGTDGSPSLQSLPRAGQRFTDYFNVAPRVLLNEADISFDGFDPHRRPGWLSPVARGPAKPVGAFQIFAKG
jgi:predicted lysophospholipase L1 biosynthesis ABC-type transport system permease subunit